MTILDHPTKTQTDWKRLRDQTEADIIRSVDDDPDAAPIATAEDMQHFKPAPARRPV